MESYELGLGTKPHVVPHLCGDAPDPAALRRIDWELAPFYCLDCDLNYRSADWHTYVPVDEGLFDCTMGICPSGHRHVVDD